MKKLILLASGNGSNAERIVTYFKENALAEVSFILTNNPKAGVIGRAERLGVPCMIFDRKDFYESTYILELLEREQPDLIVLAGFLLKCLENIIARFPNKIVNIHPSLLPKYGGKGMYGMYVHEAVIAAQEKESGITIHYVNEHYDEGAIIFQECVSISPEDTPESLAQKIHEVEYRTFPVIIKQLLQN